MERGRIARVFEEEQLRPYTPSVLERFSRRPKQDVAISAAYVLIERTLAGSESSDELPILRASDAGRQCEREGRDPRARLRGRRRCRSAQETS